MGNSQTKFSNKSTALEAADNVDLNGKVCIVTGCNAGIGKETVRVLALRNAKVYMLCRTLKKANDARDDIINEIKKLKKDFDESKLIVMTMDLSSLLSVRRCAGKYVQLNEPIDYLILNAGIMALPKFTPSTEGYELQFATSFV